MNGINPSTNHLPGICPIFKKGQEPLPPGLNEEDRPIYEQQKRWEGYAGMAMESCAVKTVLAGTMGFGIGAFFSLMSASFAYEDPYLRTQGKTAAQLNATQKASAIFKDMGRGMWTSGKGFGKVGALYAGIECVIESYRAKNDIYNSVASGFLAGGVLARNAGPKAVVGGGLAFAAFSAAIDAFMRREPSEDD
ncbi:mitochondrial import inner membrane translocase subunit TIM22 [Coprinellus micaceus]|uniref:Mitochondrial import inner membrane translocase subunit TIM22 n=1 Tax=Coprinellus micaceus TaxID=71717 RepID=A0A4Y7TWB8_COPMI|nr:mitochondrial import inner membrane translocase subunit TIM22 [Coprinellus micaceus]